MSAIGKGDWVQFVKTRPGADLTAYGMRLGGVYCVDSLTAEVGSCSACGDDGPGIEIVGVAKEQNQAFCACQFKPLGGNAKTRTAPPQEVFTEWERKLQDA